MVRRVRPEAAKDAHTYPVLVRVRTSTVAGAGTSAAVFVSLFGTTGQALKQVSPQYSKPCVLHLQPISILAVDPPLPAAAAAAHAGFAPKVLPWQRRRLPGQQVHATVCAVHLLHLFPPPPPLPPTARSRWAQ